MLTRLTRVYITAVVGLGAIALGSALLRLHITEPGLFVTLALLAILGGGLKIRVPGVDGNVSLSFVPLILSSVLLSSPEAMLITAFAALMQATVATKKFNPLKAAFNCGALVVSVGLAGLAGGLLAGRHVELVQLALAGGVYYVANSALVTTVIGLAGNKPVREIWNDCCRLYFPYFSAGLGCALIAISGATQDERRAVQCPGLVVLPFMLFTRHYFRTVLRYQRPSPIG